MKITNMVSTGFMYKVVLLLALTFSFFFIVTNDANAQLTSGRDISGGTGAQTLVTYSSGDASSGAAGCNFLCSSNNLPVCSFRHTARMFVIDPSLPPGSWTISGVCTGYTSGSIVNFSKIDGCGITGTDPCPTGGGGGYWRTIEERWAKASATFVPPASPWVDASNCQIREGESSCNSTVTFGSCVNNYGCNVTQSPAGPSGSSFFINGAGGTVSRPIVHGRTTFTSQTQYQHPFSGPINVSGTDMADASCPLSAPWDPSRGICAAPAASSCSGNTINNCILSNGTVSGGSSGSCGTSGSCSYTCNNGTWNENNNSCIATSYPSNIRTNPQCVNGNSQIEVSWNSVPGASSYRLQDTVTRFEPGSIYSLRQSHTGLISGSSHSYQVYSEYPGGFSSGWSGSVPATALNCAAPLSASFTSSQNTLNPVITRGSSVNLVWQTSNAVSCNASGGWSGWRSINVWDTLPVSPTVTTSYTLTCSGSSGSPFSQTVTVTVLQPASSCSGNTINNCILSNGTVSGGSSGSCGTSGSCSYTCNNGTWNQNNNSCVATSYPSNIRTNPQCVNGNSQIEVSWNSVPGASSYRLQDTVTRFEPGSIYNSLRLSHTGLISGSSHSYQVYSEYPGGFSSGWSGSVSATALNCVPPTYSCTGGSLPANTAYHPNDDTGLTFNTPNVYSGSNTGTKCEYSCSSGTIRVGSSCVVPPPATPTELAATTPCGSPSRINLGWVAVPGATSYEVLINGGPGAGLPTTNSYTHSNLTPGVTYAYQVRAFGPSGNSSYSSIERAVAPGACLTPLSDLDSGSISAAGTLTQGQNVTFNSQVLNIQPNPTGAAFTTEFSYRWGGIGGWNTVNITNQSALAGNQSRNTASNSFNLNSSGRLDIQHCVDSSPDRITEIIEWNNCDQVVLNVAPSASFPVVRFWASPTTVDASQRSTLSWTVSGADNCTASAVPVANTGSNSWNGAKNSAPGPTHQQDVSPTQTTTYRLDCTRAGLTTTRTAEVQVTPPSSVTTDIKANGSNGPITINSGEAVNLVGTFAGPGLACAISNGATLLPPFYSGTGLVGTLVNPVISTTYDLSCFTAGGFGGGILGSLPGGIGDSVSVIVNAVAQPNLAPGVIIGNGTLTQGQTASFNSSVVNNGSVSTPGSFTAQFSHSFDRSTWTPFTTTNHAPLNGISAGGNTRADNSAILNLGQAGQMWVRYCVDFPTDQIAEANEVDNCLEQDFTIASAPVPPSVTLTGTPTTIIQGDSTNLNWTATDAVSCSAVGGWTSNSNPIGSQRVSPVGDTTYTVNCTGSTGLSGTGSVTITVSRPSGTLIGDTCDVAVGQSSCSGTLGWTDVAAFEPYISNQDDPDNKLYPNITMPRGSRGVTINLGTITMLLRSGNIDISRANLEAGCIGNGFVLGGLCQNPPRINIIIDKDRVRGGNTANVQIEVEAPYAVRCTITGVEDTSAISHDGTPTTQTYTRITKPLKAKQEVTVSCEPDLSIPGVDPVTDSDSVDVDIYSIEEI